MNRYDLHPGSGDDDGPLGKLPRDESSEHVLGDLDENERLLVEAGKISTDEEEDPLEGAPIINLEEVPPTLEELAEALADRLGTIGLYGASGITAQRLSLINPEILDQLNPLVLESQYYETVKKSRKWLGTEPVTLGRMIRQVNALHRQGISLEQAQEKQRESDVKTLEDLFIDPHQLLQLLGAKPESRQNVSRLSYYMTEEPAFKGVVKVMQKEGSEDETWHVEDIVIHTQELLKMRLAEIRMGMRRYKRGNQYDSFDEDLEQRQAHRVQSNIHIGNMILDNMRELTTYEEFLRQTDSSAE